ARQPSIQKFLYRKIADEIRAVYCRKKFRPIKSEDWIEPVRAKLLRAESNRNESTNCEQRPLHHPIVHNRNSITASEILHVHILTPSLHNSCAFYFTAL